MRIIILDLMFRYGTAGANRQLGYAQAFAKKGFKVDIVAFGSLSIDENINLLSEKINVYGLPSVKFHGNKYIKALYAYLCLARFLLFYKNKEDKLLVCGSEDFFPVIHLFCRNNIYHECTECPDIVGPTIISRNTYLHYCKKFDQIYIISENLKSWYIEHGISKSKLSIINMIVDSERFDNVSRNTTERYVAYCGTVSNSKDGVDDLIKDFIEYSKEFPDRYLYIIGPIYSKELKLEYHKLIEDKNATGKVKFLGMVSPTVMPQLLINAEMLMLTRPNNLQAHYGFPTKLGEYLISTRPVVVTSVGNISSFLIDKQNACVVSPDNHHAIVEAMKWISRNPDKADEMGKEGCECARLNFNNIIESEKILKSMNI